jgi:4-hydroxy-3-methylbut-2-enyl diphosphate reductase
MTTRRLNIGDRITGRVVALEAFGAFLKFEDTDLQGVVLIPDISWLKIRHPSDVLAVGQMIETEIVHFAPDRRQIRVSIKRCTKNPWDSAADRYFVGQTAEVTVLRLVSMGIIASLKDYPSIEGPIRTAVTDSQQVEIGQQLTVRIAEFDAHRQRIVFQRQ